MHLFLGLRRTKIQARYGAVSVILMTLVLSLFISPRSTTAQTRKPALSEKKFEGSITALGKDYITIDGKKYLVSKSLKIKDQKGKYTSWGLNELKFVYRVLVTLEDNIITEVQILSFQS